ncbi:MAG: PAS domain-containing protein, partial [Clostridiaceae bacterium]|nr:PAS domain-containing protein [Clostridiaceae bacterium]
EHAGCIGGACPAVVHYIEKYHPELVDQIVPVVSPMIAHARMLKERLGAGWSVVFIGPCAAKKQEAARPEYADAVDAVLTFMELGEWLEDERIDVATCIESDFESPDPMAANAELADARLFALAGGMLKTAAIHNDGVRPDVLHTSGAESVMELLDVPASGWAYQIVEPLFCAEGCINGPGIPHGKNLFERKNDLIRYAREKARLTISPSAQSTPAAASEAAAAKTDGVVAYELPASLKAAFAPAAGIHIPDIPESRILEVFEQTGKSSPDMQLNCGACGYKSCRDNAIAVVLGMAEPEMCIPYMRRLAEQRTDRILETSPNGIIILDEELKIVNINPAFRKMFQCGNAVLGRQVSYLMDASGFETLSDGGSERFEAVISHYGKRFHEVLYTLRDARQFVGIFMDISDIPLQQKTTDIVRMQTLRQAQELLDHQIRMSQEIAGMLGKSTAKGEEMVHKLMSLYGEDES